MQNFVCDLRMHVDYVNPIAFAIYNTNIVLYLEKIVASIRMFFLRNYHVAKHLPSSSSRKKKRETAQFIEISPRRARTCESCWSEWLRNFSAFRCTSGRCEKVKRKTRKIASRDWNDSTMHDKNVSRVRCNSVPKSLLRKSARKAKRIAGNRANVLQYAYSDILSCLIIFLFFLQNFDDILFLLNAFFIW